MQLGYPLPPKSVGDLLGIGRPAVGSAGRIFLGTPPSAPPTAAGRRWFPGRWSEPGRFPGRGSFPPLNHADVICADVDPLRQLFLAETALLAALTDVFTDTAVIQRKILLLVWLSYG